MCNPAAGPPPARQIARFRFLALAPVASAGPVPTVVIASRAALLAPGALSAKASIAAMASAGLMLSGIVRANFLIAAIAAIAAAGSLDFWTGVVAAGGSPPVSPPVRLLVFAGLSAFM